MTIEEKDQAVETFEIEVPANITLVQVPSDCKLLVAYTDLNINQGSLEVLATQLGSISMDIGIPILVLDKKQTALENISDESLAKLGLKRINTELKH